MPGLGAERGLWEEVTGSGDIEQDLKKLKKKMVCLPVSTGLEEDLPVSN